MAGTHKSQISTWMARLANAYGSNPANSVDMRRILSSDQNVFEIDAATETDADYDNGSDIAEDLRTLTNDSGVTIPFDLNFQDIGYALYDALGGYAVSEITTGVYLHTFTPQNVNTSRQLPSRAMFKKYGGLKTLAIWDAVTTALQISSGKTDRLKCSRTVKGSGDYAENPSGYNQPDLESDREFGYAQQARFWLDVAASGTAQVETATVAGTISGAGNVAVVVTSALLRGGSKTFAVAVANSDTAAQVAGKIRDSLGVDSDIVRHFTVSGSTTAVVLTAKVKAANDTTLNIATATGTATGLTTVATSTNTTAGVAGSTLNPACQIQSWSLDLNNPEADPGYNVCSPYLVAGNPLSGAIRTEYLVGGRDYMFNYTVWLGSNDAQRTWFRTGQELTLDLQLIGTLIASTGYFYELNVEHSKVRIMPPKESIEGNFIGVQGQAKLMADGGAIPLTITLQNDVASYAS